MLLTSNNHAYILFNPNPNPKAHIFYEISSDILSYKKALICSCLNKLALRKENLWMHNQHSDYCLIADTTGADMVFIALGQFHIKQGKSEGYDSCDWPCNLKWNPNRFFSWCDLEIWQLTAGNVLHAPSSYVCHFIVMYEFKLELSSGEAQIRAKSSIFWPPLTDLTDDLEKQQDTSSMPLQALFIIL